VTTEVTRDELYRALSAGEAIVLVEALGADYYADAHLPGAINIPADQVDALAPTLLPDRGANIVVYCSGMCSNSEIAADRLSALGYERVRVYYGGKEDWLEHGLPLDRSSDPA